MRITGVEVCDIADGAEIRADVVWERPGLDVDRVWIRYQGFGADEIVSPASVLALCMFIPSMAVGEDMFVDGPLSRKLWDGLRQSVETNHSWHPTWHPTQIGAVEEERVDLRPEQTASLFSGGLDSFYTALRPRTSPIDAFVTVAGIDLRFDKRAAIDLVMPRLVEAGRKMGKPVIALDTNAYEIGHRYVTKAEHHGAVLAGVVAGLGAQVRICLLPANIPGPDPKPWGGQTTFDPRWSTETLEFRNDYEVGRVKKGLAIADDQVVLDYVRVCLKRPDLYNCRRCDKCVSTALIFHLAGTLERSSVLGPVTPDIVRKTRVGHAYLDVFGDLRRRIEDPSLRRAVSQALWRGRLVHGAQPLVDAIRRRRLRRRIRAWDESRA